MYEKNEEKEKVDNVYEYENVFEKVEFEKVIVGFENMYE